MTRIVVLQRWLLDPGNTQFLQSLATFYRGWDVQTLVIVNHDAEIVAHSVANATNHRKILCECWIADFGLHCTKPLLRCGNCTLGCQSLAIQAVTVVCRYRPRASPEHFHQRHLVSFCQRIPCSHVDASGRHPDQPRVASKTEAFGQHGFEVYGCQRLIYKQLRHVIQQLLKRLQSNGSVSKQIRVSDHTRASCQVNQNQRSRSHCSDSGVNWI
ncbi:hypothetical protein D9M71_596430 [compost metagenome]